LNQFFFQINWPNLIIFVKIVLKNVHRPLFPPQKRPYDFSVQKGGTLLLQMREQLTQTGAGNPRAPLDMQIAFDLAGVSSNFPV